MIDLPPDLIADSLGAQVVQQGASGGPTRASIDSRALEPGNLFFGLPGERVDGGEFAGQALDAGAWGVVVTPERAAELVVAEGSGWIFSTPDPLRALQGLAV